MPGTSAKYNLFSMTGYAVAETSLAGSLFRIHLKSVNHRYLEMKWRAPRAWAPFEIEGRSIFQEKLGRGSLDCWIETLDTAPGAPQTAKRMEKLMSQAQAAMGPSRGLSALWMPAVAKAVLLARFPEYWLDEATEETRLTPEAAKAAFVMIADKLLETRRIEGEKLENILRGSLQRLRESLATVEAQLPNIQKAHNEQFRLRMEALREVWKVPEILEPRMMQEYLFLAEKRDVAEELGRIHIHLRALEGILDQPPAQTGKRIDFMVQELHREWTTLGTKIHDPQMIQTIIDAKLEIDRIKEQAANIA